jgi:nucleotide-sensitive chloride channel 1A
MSVTILARPPQSDDFTPLSEHQEQTPSTFFPSKPVLHFHVDGHATLRIRTEELKGKVQFEALAGANGTQDAEDTVMEGSDVWVTSK